MSAEWVEEITTTREMASGGEKYGRDERIGSWQNPPGRFPANVIHDGSEEVVQGFPDVNGEIGRANRKEAGEYEATSYKVGVVTDYQIKDSGSASRFFYTAKASKKDRDEGLQGFDKGVNMNDGRKCTEKQCFNEEKTPTQLRNIHPTVKPTDLMQYLIRLIAPKGATVLDLFMGSGSTGKAAMIENVEREANYHFIGIDRTEEYLPIAQARIEFGRNYAEEKPKADGVVHKNQIDLFSLL
jgi:site-specific DNA-methyltransferase (adenine-specific)